MPVSTSFEINLNPKQKMRFKNLYLFIFLMAATFTAYSQNQKDPQQIAEDIVEQLGERMFIESSKRDSLVMVFKTFLEDRKRYKGKGSKVDKALMATRDADIRTILNDSQLEEYQKFLKEVTAPKPQTKGPRPGSNHR